MGNISISDVCPKDMSAYDKTIIKSLFFSIHVGHDGHVKHKHVVRVPYVVGNEFCRTEN